MWAKARDIGREAWRVSALRALAEFFCNDRNELISARGKQVLEDPSLMARIEAALARHQAEGRRGPLVVDLSEATELGQAASAEASGP